MSAFRLIGLTEKESTDGLSETLVTVKGSWVANEWVAVDFTHGEQIIAANAEFYSNYTLSVRFLVVDL